MVPMSWPLFFFALVCFDPLFCRGLVWPLVLLQQTDSRVQTTESIVVFKETVEHFVPCACSMLLVVCSIITVEGGMTVLRESATSE